MDAVTVTMTADGAKSSLNLLGCQRAIERTGVNAHGPLYLFRLL